MSSEKNRKQQDEIKINKKNAAGQLTRQKILINAQTLFCQKGYKGASMEDLVNSLELTRGALYHHFPSKKKLFMAVVEDSQKEVVERINIAIKDKPDIWQEFLAGCVAFLEISLNPALQRILLIEAPSVIGWDMWRKIDAQHGLSELQKIIEKLEKGKIIKAHSTTALSYLLNGAMNEVALWIASSDSPKNAFKKAEITLKQILENLRI